MNRSTYALLTILLFGISSPSFGSSNLEILKSLYNSASTPAATTDFPEKNYADGTFIQPQISSCAVVDEVDQPYGFDASRNIRYTPAQGPLLPGTRVEKLTFGDVSQSYDLIMPPTVGQTDLIVTNPIYRTWVDSNQGVTHFVAATLSARKSGIYVAFMISIKYGSSLILDEQYFGYCYPLGKAMF